MILRIVLKLIGLGFLLGTTSGARWAAADGSGRRRRARRRVADELRRMADWMMERDAESEDHHDND